MPVSFRGLSKGSALGKCKVFWGNTTQRCGDFFKNPKGLTLSFDETLITFAHRTKQVLCFLKKMGRTKMSQSDIMENRKQKKDNLFCRNYPFSDIENIIKAML